MHELKTNREAARLKSTKSEVASRVVESRRRYHGGCGLG